jgi:hypothetical protein
VFSGVKVFTATMAQERESLGDKITEWLRNNEGVKVVDKIVTQSSDNAFHCLSITLFYTGQAVWNDTRRRHTNQR